jgi:hypothetical protein
LEFWLPKPVRDSDAGEHPAQSAQRALRFHCSVDCLRSWKHPDIGSGARQQADVLDQGLMVEGWFPVDAELCAYLFEQINQLLGVDIQ